MTATKIEWTDRTWNPVSGCTKVSPGCDNCYAEGIARRFAGGSAFPNGFDVTLRPGKLNEPLRWRKPARVFVNSMSDLFHDAVPDEFIAQVFGVMALASAHTFQVLTKRHGRMRSLLSDPGRLCALNPNGLGHWIRDGHWPLRNVWLGVSAEDQKRADLRIPALLDTPAAVRFLSCEPLLGPVDLEHVDFTGHEAANQVDWVIVGGESGPGARPVHPAWVRSLRDQCTAADVPFFFKQWGEWAPLDQPNRSVFDYVTDDDRCQIVDVRGQLRGRPWGGWKIMDGTRDAEPVRRYGKTIAGRELDGRTWDEFPAVAS